MGWPAWLVWFGLVCLGGGAEGEGVVPAARLPEQGAQLQGRDAVASSARLSWERSRGGGRVPRCLGPRAEGPGSRERWDGQPGCCVSPGRSRGPHVNSLVSETEARGPGFKGEMWWPAKAGGLVPIRSPVSESQGRGSGSRER